MKSDASGSFHGHPPTAIRTVLDRRTELLDRNIANILEVIRDAMVVDLAFVSRRVWDDAVISHASCGPGGIDVQGRRRPISESFCQRVLDGHLPALVPDVSALRSTHEIPPTPIVAGAYMTTPVRLQDGTLYGLPCCVRRAVAPESNEIHQQRLEMSARQIARLVAEAGER